MKVPVSIVEPGPTRTDMWTNIFADFDAATDAMSPEHRSLYRRQLTGMRAMLPRVQRTAAPPDAVAAAIERAVTARRPRRFYLCDPPSRVQMAAARLMPAAVTEAALSSVTLSR